MPNTAPPPTGARQRLDKWLWFTRVVRTRSLAAKLVEEGHVRVNSIRTEQSAKAVKPGDVVTVALAHDVRVMRVVSAGERRGPAPEARLLYIDLSAASERRADEGDDDD